MNNHYTTALLALEERVQPKIIRDKTSNIRADVKIWADKERLRNSIVNNFYFESHFGLEIFEGKKYENGL